MSAGTNVDQVLRYKGFDVEISGVDGAPQQDGTWTSVTGGGTAVGIVDAGPAASRGGKLVTGPAYVTPLILSGPVVKGRTALLAWLREAAAGKDAIRQVTITPFDSQGKLGPSHVYVGCWIEEYRIPKLDAGSADPIEEVVVLRPTRYNDPA